MPSEDGLKAERIEALQEAAALAMARALDYFAAGEDAKALALRSLCLDIRGLIGKTRFPADGGLKVEITEDMICGPSGARRP